MVVKDRQDPTGEALLADEGEQIEFAGALDRAGDESLVFRAVAGVPTRKDLSTIGHVSPQATCILVIYEHLCVGAKSANFPAHATKSTAHPSGSSTVLMSLISHFISNQ